MPRQASNQLTVANPCWGSFLSLIRTRSLTFFPPTCWSMRSSRSCRCVATFRPAARRMSPSGSACSINTQSRWKLTPWSSASPTASLALARWPLSIARFFSYHGGNQAVPDTKQRMSEESINGIRNPIVRLSLASADVFIFALKNTVLSDVPTV